jgi:5-methylcytosine-specific restriction endonuclease McrA
MNATQRKTYRAFLRSPEWEAKRRACIARDGAACRRCGSRFRLEVHHLTYLRFGGREHLSDLITLCERCHEALHEHARKARPGRSRNPATTSTTAQRRA